MIKFRAGRGQLPPFAPFLPRGDTNDATRSPAVASIADRTEYDELINDHLENNVH